MAVLKRLFDIRPHEWPRFSLLFLAFFVYNVGVSWSSSSVAAIILNELGAEFVAQGLVFFGATTIVASIIYTAFVDRIPKHRLLTIMTFISAALVGLVLLALLAGERTFAAAGLFVLSEAILLIWVLQWKTNIIDFYDTRTSKRILPLLGVGRLVGLSFGGFSYPFLTDTMSLNADMIVAMWFGTLVLVLFIVGLIPRLMNDPKPEPVKHDGGYLDSIQEGFSYIGKSDYLKWMAISAILMNALIALFQFKAGVLVEDYYRLTITDDALREVAIGNFFATIDAYSSLVMLFVQLFIFPRIMDRIGLGNVNLIYPTVSFGVSIGLGLSGAFPTAFMPWLAGTAHIDRKTFRRVFRSPVNGLLINAVPSFMKGRARSVINGVISPVAVIIIGLLIQIESDSLFTILVFGVGFGYMVTGFVLKREYSKAMVKLLENEDYASLLSQDTDLGKADAETMRLLAKQLVNAPTKELKGFIASIIAEMGGKDAIPILLEIAPQLDVEGQIELIDSMIEAEALSIEARAYLINYVSHENMRLRRLALTGLMMIIPPQEEAHAKLAMDHVNDPDHVIRLNMAKQLIQYGNTAQKDRAQRVLNASLTDFNPQVRIEAILVLVELDDVYGIRSLVTLMEDESDEVRYEATIAIEQLWRDEMPQDILQLLIDRSSMLLDDPVERIRQAEIHILSLMGGEVAYDTLMKALDDNSLFIRQSTLEAIQTLGVPIVPYLEQARQGDDSKAKSMATLALHTMQRQKLTSDLLASITQDLHEMYDNYRVVVALQDCVALPSIGVIVSHYIEQNEQTIDNAFFILETMYGKSISTIRETLTSANNKTKMNSLEALESLSTPEIARLIAPVYTHTDNYEHLASVSDKEALTSRDVIEQLAKSDDDWLRSVAMFALGEIGRENLYTRNLLLQREKNDNIPDGYEAEACYDIVPPEIISVMLQGARRSRTRDVKNAARSAIRLILDQTIIQQLSQTTVETPAVTSDTVSQLMQQKDNTSMLSTIERMIYLKQSEFFNSLSIEQLKALATICDETLIKEGETLFQQGDDGGALYIVISGQIDIDLVNKDTGDKVVLAKVESNQVFGEMSLFDGSKRSADAIASEDTLMLTLRREPFLALTRQYPTLSVHLITTLSDRLRRANSQIANLSDTLSKKVM